MRITINYSKKRVMYQMGLDFSPKKLFSEKLASLNDFNEKVKEYNLTDEEIYLDQRENTFIRMYRPATEKEIKLLEQHIIWQNFFLIKKECETIKKTNRENIVFENSSIAYLEMAMNYKSELIKRSFFEDFDINEIYKNSEAASKFIASHVFSEPNND